MICPCCGIENYSEARSKKIDEMVFDWLKRRKDIKTETVKYKKWSIKKKIIESGIRFENKHRLLGEQPCQYEQESYSARDIMQQRSSDMYRMKVKFIEIKESIHRVILKDNIRSDSNNILKFRVYYCGTESVVD